MSPDNCPPECGHETFEYCAAAGTHCDKHCVCQCYMCRAEHGVRRARVAEAAPTAARPATVDVDVLRCKDCGNEGTDFYYDTDPAGLPAMRNRKGEIVTCSMGSVMTGEPGAERCIKCGSLNVEFTGKTTPVPADATPPPHPQQGTGTPGERPWISATHSGP